MAIKSKKLDMVVDKFACKSTCDEELLKSIMDKANEKKLKGVIHEGDSEGDDESIDHGGDEDGSTGGRLAITN